MAEEIVRLEQDFNRLLTYQQKVGVLLSAIVGWVSALHGIAEDPKRSNERQVDFDRDLVAVNDSLERLFKTVAKPSEYPHTDVMDGSMPVRCVINWTGLHEKSVVFADHFNDEMNRGMTKETEGLFQRFLFCDAYPVWCQVRNAAARWGLYNFRSRYRTVEVTNSIDRVLERIDSVVESIAEEEGPLELDPAPSDSPGAE